MSLRQCPKARTVGRCVRLPAVPQIIQTLLPQLFNIRKVSDVLGNGPLSIDLQVRVSVVQIPHKCLESGHRTAKSFDEVGEHPQRVNEAELSLRPWRTIEL